MKNIRSIIDELDRLVPERDKHHIIEARASNVIASCINVMQLIAESFDDEEAEELNKRLLSAIRNKDPNKFNRKIKEMKGKNDK
jgi:uncharacterized protein (UPF0305 family)